MDYFTGCGLKCTPLEASRRFLEIIICMDGHRDSASPLHTVLLYVLLIEWVSVGFSSTTGDGVEIYYILLWGFNSTGLISDEGEDPIPPTNDDAIPPMSNNGIKAQGGAVIGVVIGFSLWDHIDTGFWFEEEEY
ncbi:hypothetical protein LWI29_014960 [Acer saccharum]|uniref:Uncharacterized protein n=1 Tax=Acer saccharum TaxID=4024 RepID=A0AA39VT01_ACESA|nr:hypothetical protein LWI29_014960 [Acer saccharum]